MTVAYRIQDGEKQIVRVIMKGAPEEVLRKCIHKLDELGYD